MMNRHAIVRRAVIAPMCVAVISTAALQASCTRAPDSKATGSQSAASNTFSLDEFKLGTRLAMNGQIAPGTEKTAFSADQTIHLTMRLRNPPRDAVVKVVWKAPGGETVGDEEKSVLPGQEYMYFSADGESLPKGVGYQAELSANGAPVTVLKFDLVSGG